MNTEHFRTTLKRELAIRSPQDVGPWLDGLEAMARAAMDAATDELGRRRLTKHLDELAAVRLEYFAGQPDSVLTAEIERLEREAKRMRAEGEVLQAEACRKLGIGGAA